MTNLAKHHKLIGWILAVGWLGAAVLLVLSFPEIEVVGEYGVFLKWTPLGAVLALLTWVWSFGSRWNHANSLVTIAVAFGAWALLIAAGADGRVHLAARDAFFLRQPGPELALRGILWLYLLHPLAIMAAGCLAIVEYLRYPPRWVKAALTGCAPQDTGSN